jgi:hypothetical protein
MGWFFSAQLTTFTLYPCPSAFIRVQLKIFSAEGCYKPVRVGLCVSVANKSGEAVEGCGLLALDECSQL